MRTAQLIGVLNGPAPEDVDAVVITLKSRTSPVDEAVAESVATVPRFGQTNLGSQRPQLNLESPGIFQRVSAASR